MQTQKDEIKKRILEAALEEFLVEGYHNSSLRNIAQQAGMTVGNIYSYFSSKEELFDSVLQPTIEQMEQLVKVKVPEEEVLSLSTITELTQLISKVFLQNRPEFLILMNGSEGSKHENMKSALTRMLSPRLSAELLPRMNLSSSDTLLAEAISVSLVEGILHIFNGYGGDEQRLGALLENFITTIFKHR